MQLTDNFHIKEFYCNDGTAIPRDYIANVVELANNLQVLRDHIDAPIHILSAFRHTEYNKRIGGAKKSQHLTASAADIYCPIYTPAELYLFIEDLIAMGKMKDGGLGKYSTFVHYDVREYRARWNG